LPGAKPRKTIDFVSRPLRATVLAAFGAVLLTGGLIVYVRSTAQPSAKILNQARQELARGRHARAEELARRVLQRSPADGWALLVAAEAALGQEHTEAALRYYEQVPDDGSPQSISGLFGAGEILCHQGRLSDSEKRLRQALERDPHHLLAHYRLAFLLGITGRRWESVPHIVELLRQGHFTVENLLMLGDVERVANEKELLAASRETAPDDPLPLLGEARIAVAYNETQIAEPLLKRVLAANPREIEAQARLGGLLLDRGASDEFREWLAALPPAADDHPEIWLVRGRASLEEGAPRAAVRCFWEAALRDSENRMANYRLGQTLSAIGETALAARFLERARILQILATVLDGLFHNQHLIASMQKAEFFTESLGRAWEAYGWARAALAEDPSLPWAQDAIVRLEPLLGPDTPRTLPEQNLARQIDLASYPLPQAERGHQLSKHGGGAPHEASRVHFVDHARDAGIDFVYFNSPDESTQGARLFETTGGGVAALDYDGDAWPDLYFTQGCRWPVDKGPDTGKTEYRDRFYRNLGDGRAADVTESAGLGDVHFSQGIAAGDYDNDGFPDLYLANIGQNRLYHNNGDGTFRDMTGTAGLTGEIWTTSCLLADLNGDGWPDLYDVTYCAGNDAFSRLCKIDGRSRSCSPRAFDAAPDRVFVSRGDGTFENVTLSSGIDVPNGYGLGIVAADFDGSGRLNLFIANDETANFYFVNQTDRPGGPLRFVEQALLAGVAFDADGLAQACMGVAAGDADGDGLIDLYVSNFYNESDTLYVQKRGGSFVDQTRAAGLRDPVLTNGHIDDLRDIGQPYEMSPQYFRNLGGGRFQEVPSAALGKFFEGKYLGRGLARLDWDRDGKEDFAVSHVKSPAALVLNRTERTGHSIALSLRGITGDRDAIGTTVEVTAGDRTWTQQLTAGDGYQASNERRLIFGLGEASTIDTVQIRWLSGGTQTFTSVPADAEYIVIEQRQALRKLR
jgi:tetratricopeptide (TPR) repeat protein